MKISEVAEATGLDISAIRFYERKGLIVPARSEGSTYRSYTDEDVRRIKQIVLYRKMDLSIETIGHLLEEPADLQNVLKTQEEQLLAERERLDGALDLCRKMIDDQVSEDLDIIYYLDYVTTEEKQGKKYPAVMEMLDELAYNSGIEWFGGIPLLYGLSCHKWLRYLIGAAVFLILVVFPVVVVTVKILEWENGQAGLQSVVFWIFYLFVCWGAFARIAKGRTKRGKA